LRQKVWLESLTTTNDNLLIRNVDGAETRANFILGADYFVDEDGTPVSQAGPWIWKATGNRYVVGDAMVGGSPLPPVTTTQKPTTSKDKERIAKGWRFPANTHLIDDDTKIVEDQELAPHIAEFAKLIGKNMCRWDWGTSNFTLGTADVQRVLGKDSKRKVSEFYEGNLSKKMQGYSRAVNVNHQHTALWMHHLTGRRTLYYNANAEAGIYLVCLDFDYKAKFDIDLRNQLTGKLREIFGDETFIESSRGGNGIHAYLRVDCKIGKDWQAWTRTAREYLGVGSNLCNYLEQQFPEGPLGFDDIFGTPALWNENDRVVQSSGKLCKVPLRVNEFMAWWKQEHIIDVRELNAMANDGPGITKQVSVPEASASPSFDKITEPTPQAPAELKDVIVPEEFKQIIQDLIATHGPAKRRQKVAVGEAKGNYRNLVDEEPRAFTLDDDELTHMVWLALGLVHSWGEVEGEAGIHAISIDPLCKAFKHYKGVKSHPSYVAVLRMWCEVAEIWEKTGKVDRTYGTRIKVKPELMKLVADFKERKKQDGVYIPWTIEQIKSESNRNVARWRFAQRYYDQLQNQGIAREIALAYTEQATDDKVCDNRRLEQFIEIVDSLLHPKPKSK
jgi:hypothetical protein